MLLIFKSIKNTTSNIPVKREKTNYAFQIMEFQVFPNLVQ